MSYQRLHVAAGPTSKLVGLVVGRLVLSQVGEQLEEKGEESIVFWLKTKGG